MADQEIQEIADSFMMYLGEADTDGVVGMSMDARDVTPEKLRDMINKAKDAPAKYNHLEITGNFAADGE